MRLALSLNILTATFIALAAATPAIASPSSDNVILSRDLLGDEPRPETDIRYVTLRSVETAAPAASSRQSTSVLHYESPLNLGEADMRVRFRARLKKKSILKFELFF